uniref:Glycosyltransferase n=1 Tax=Panax notoginseng TaxID=44586 RepID=A0A977R8Y0_9APIA|nr:UGT56 [Panax notoginseng]
MANEESRFRVLMFPMLSYGHVSPFLELAKILSQKNFYLYVCSTPINLNSIKKRLIPSIELVELHLSSSPPELPPHYHTSNGLGGHLLPALLKSFEMSKPEFTIILEKLNPDLIIYDIFPPWIIDLAFSYHIPAVHFMCAGAASSSFFYSSVKNSSVPQFPSSGIFLKDSEVIKRKNALGEIKSAIFTSFERSCDIVLIKSCRDMEGKYIDHFHSILTNKKVISMGPLTEELDNEGGDLEEDADIILQWLDKKDKASTIYLSLGSESFLSKKDMEELAHGLKLSNVNFIWAIRFPKGEDIKAEVALPKGFLERVGGRGLVVEGWAPQTRILGHSSIGGFVSHCGWASVIESLGFGVPIVGIPMNFDQPINARLAVELGAGLEVLKDENLELERKEVARVIREVVIEKSGEEIRKKAREMSEKIRLKGDEEIDDGVEELRKICHKKKQILDLK